jgi:uncharacterized repeat protein (TIGR03803 family)
MASHSRVARAYKTCVALLFCTALAVSSDAQTFTNLLSFNGTDGERPYAPLVQGLDGNLYGTTAGYGTNPDGTVFKITAGGKLTTLYNFCQQANCADGAYPIAGLVQTTSGNIYGTTYGGGAGGKGTVFKIAPGGELTVLHAFCQSDCSDGANPVAGLMQGSDGAFYGTTYGGGTSGDGTVFKMNPEGKITIMHSFNGSDGANPEGGLLQATDGSFYGTTYGAAVGNCLTLGCGTVFKVTPTGNFTTLYVFCTQSYCSDGSNPVASLIEGADGEFYGTTSNGGGTEAACEEGCGTVFKITSHGKLTTLYRFCAIENCYEGTLPTGSLLQATDGKFYGTTLLGGGSGYNCNFAYGEGCGTVFIVTPGHLTTLHSFGTADAGSPWAGLVQDTDGTFYGTTTGGTATLGTVFGLAVGLHPFVKTLPTWGEVGTAVEILGTTLKGATEVRFNETAAVFTVVSNTEIKTSVPTGATTGFVTVTTPGGTLKSNKKFRVIQ